NVIRQPEQNALARCLHAAIQVDGTNYRLGGIGENGFAPETTAFELTGPQTEKLSQLEALGQLGEGDTLHQPGAQARQLPFSGLREALEQRVRGHKVENGVTKEFEALVIAPPKTTMGQRQNQKYLVLEAVPDLAFLPV